MFGWLGFFLSLLTSSYDAMFFHALFFRSCGMCCVCECVCVCVRGGGGGDGQVRVSASQHAASPANMQVYIKREERSLSL